MLDPERGEGGFVTERPSAWDELAAAGLIEFIAPDFSIFGIRHVRPTKKGIAYAKRWFKQLAREREAAYVPPPGHRPPGHHLGDTHL